MQTGKPPTGLWSSESSTFGVVHCLRHGNPREQVWNPRFQMESVAWSSDGAFLCTASGDKTCRVFEVATRRNTFTTVHPDWMRCSAFNRAGTHFVAAGDDSHCRMYDLSLSDLEEPVRTFEHVRSIRSVDFSPDDRFLLTSSLDKKARVYKLVEDPPPPPGQEKPKEEKPPEPPKEAKEEGVPCCHKCGAPYENPLFCKKCGEKRKKQKKVVEVEVKVPPEPKPEWEGTGQIRELKHVDYLAEARFNGDGTRVITASGAPRFMGLAMLWDVEFAEELLKLEHDDAVSSARLSPCEKMLLTGCWDKGARLFSMEDGQELRLWKHSNFVQGVGWSHDGRFVCTACADGNARIFDVRTRTEMQCFRHPEPVSVAAFSPNSLQLVTASADAGIRVWGAIG